MKRKKARKPEGLKIWRTHWALIEWVRKEADGPVGALWLHPDFGTVWVEMNTAGKCTAAGDWPAPKEAAA